MEQRRLHSKGFLESIKHDWPWIVIFIALAIFCWILNRLKKNKAFNNMMSRTYSRVLMTMEGIAPLGQVDEKIEIYDDIFVLPHPSEPRTTDNSMKESLLNAHFHHNSKSSKSDRDDSY
jgi:hypothetical protein